MKPATRNIADSALFAALISVGAVFSIPLPPPLPPISPAVFFVLLAGLLLGPGGGGAAVGIYLLLGALGLPVFANGAGGLGYFGGPTGGFLLGYLAAALVTGALADRRKWGAIRSILAAAAGVLALYAVGLPWMQRVLAARAATMAAAAAMMIPYFIGDLVKAAAAALLVRALRPVLGRHFSREDR